MFGFARTSTMGWLALTAGLAGIVTVEVAGTATSSDPVSDEASDRVEIDDTMPTIVTRSAPATVNAILKRPLFSASRKPSGVTAAGSPFQLIGTMVTADMPGDGAGVAILQHPSQGQLLRRAGEMIDGWTIVVIEPFRIALRRDDDITHLQLMRDPVQLKRDPAQAKVEEDTVDSVEKEQDGSPDGEKPRRRSMEELEAHADETALEAWLESNTKNVK